MSIWLQVLMGILAAVREYVNSAERARRDEMELKILRELLSELDKLIAPLVAAATSGTVKASQATIEQVMNIMKRSGTALASYAYDNVADYIEDKSMSNAAAVQASMRLHEALVALLGVIGNQRQWLKNRFHRPALNRLLYKPYRVVEPADFQMQVVELMSMLDSVALEAERAQRDVALAHHPARYFLPGISGPLAPTPPETENSPISRREPRQVLRTTRELRKMYSSTLLFVEEFAQQVKTRLEQHTRPGGGINAIIVRAQIILTISFCLQSQLMLDGMRTAIDIVGKNVIIAY